MPRIIAGRFKSRDRAEKVTALLVKCIDRADIFIFHDSPLGQRYLFISGGDEDGKSCSFGICADGVNLSVRVLDAANEECVVATLRAESAGNIEQSEGEWLDGDWVDFDSVAATRLVKKRSIASGSRGGAAN